MTPHKTALLGWIDALVGRRVLVVGDVFLDEYLIGHTDRLSREAPVPVLEFERRITLPGGAANPAANVAGLGGAAVQIGVIGADENGAALHDSLTGLGIDASGLVVDATRQTTTKTRIMAHMGLRFPQQVARIDRIDRQPIDGEVEQSVVSAIQGGAPGAGAVMLSDYLVGMLTARVVAAAREACARHGALCTADAQGQLGKYAGFDVVKCNADEVSRFAGQALERDDDFAQTGAAMAARLGLRRGMLITRGPDGITVAEPDRVTHLRAPRVEDVYDTVGAGDTVLAVVTLALTAGASLVEAAALANLAAAIVIRRVGNYAPTPDELRA
ncbi:MAG: ribokinase, partial [Anaerolineae bacterium]|nr:ribokinase [Anaerolineae bacterium]